MPLAGLSNLLVSLGHTDRKSFLGQHIEYMATVITKISHNVLGKFMLLCWAAFIAILSLMQPVGHRLDTPVRVSFSPECHCYVSKFFISVTWMKLAFP